MSPVGFHQKLGIATALVVGAVLPFLFAPLLAKAAIRLGWSAPHLVVILISFGLTVVACVLLYVPFRWMGQRRLRLGLERVQRAIGEAESDGSPSAFDDAWDQALELHRSFPFESVEGLIQRLAAEHPDIERALDRKPPRPSKPQRLTIPRNDPILGELRYVPEILYWRGRVPFAPLGQMITVDVGNDGEGLFARQRGWYQELERRYDALQPQIAQLLQSESPSAETFDRFRLDRVNFPDHPTEDPTLALGYKSPATRWAYWVSVENWKPLEVDRVRKSVWEPNP